VALITRSKKEIEKAFSKLEKATRGYGLRINEEKTKYLIMKQKITIDEPYSKFRTKKNLQLRKCHILRIPSSTTITKKSLRYTKE
jgi:hypothetical protein